MSVSRDIELVMAIRTNHDKAIPEFLTWDNVAREIEFKKTPIELALHYLHWECVEMIAKSQRASPGCRYGHALLVAANIPRMQTVKILLDVGASTDWSYTDSGNNSLHCAVQNNDINMLKLLLSNISFHIKLADENKNKLTPMQLARSLNHWDCVNTIAMCKTTDAKDEARYGETLFFAVKEKRMKSAKLLLDANTPQIYQNPEHKDYCIHQAVRNKQPEMIALLLSKNASLSILNGDGLTPRALSDNIDNGDCINHGWKINYDQKHEIQFSTLLVIFAQGQCQTKSPLSKLPTALLNFIIKFLTIEHYFSEVNSVHIKQKQIETRRQKKIIESTHTLLREYPKTWIGGLFRKSSPASVALVKELKGVVNSKEPDKAKKIESAIGSFTKEQQGKNLKTLRLLEKFNLVPSEAVVTDELKPQSGNKP